MRWRRVPCPGAPDAHRNVVISARRRKGFVAFRGAVI
jgi:hypothetical protein